MDVSRGLSMATTRLCRLTTSSFLAPFVTRASTPCIAAAARCFSSAPTLFAAGGSRPLSDKEKAAREKIKRRRKKHRAYKQYNLKDMEQFTLCEAMRYIKAFEVGREPDSPKYDIHIKLRTKKDGPVVRNSIRLPYPVKTDIKVAVICPPNSTAAQRAREAGAHLIGEEELFERIKAGKIDFDRCIAVPESLQKMNKEGIPRILGPRGLMPSVKMGSVVTNPGPAVRNMMGGSTYRERQGVVRMAVGRLSFTPEQLRDNVKAYVNAVKKDSAALSDQIVKEIYEVVLSSTNSPGFSLTGDFYKPAPGAATPQQLAVI
ncbi:ribosomal protein L1 [Cladophialophora bantiana CBS 173.52]|uniref:Ribosomal protein L1 n=1 Tax=Cladophialophora bantiana (strain ATCC 10958 / CBS 173.52 / CDC B-1940 / NIH 8579) TaxID=1442370 RepID=A0A0D2ENR4_CLAB1|nr:ribosomal protein L1 [Cladophialophora bantiana CBS 173.52]KIW91626.1 ribosomal protein L1 [Cladophialophora bantiana CBS 173.52]